MNSAKIKLKSEALHLLLDKLNANQMRAILTLGSGNQMPDEVTKLDLTIIIVVLCQQLDWIEEEECLSEIAEVAAHEEHSVAGHDPLNVKTDQHESGPHTLEV